LVPCGGGDVIPLVNQKLVVGRKDDCDITLQFRSVSARHCELEFNGGFWFLRDLGSRNGTAVNGVRCRETQLMPNDIVSFARQRYSILYRLEDHASSAVSQQSRSHPQTGETPRASSTSPPATRRTGAAFGRLVPCGGGVPVPLFDPILLVGRASSCDIQLVSSLVSSRHCRLEFKDGYWFVQDLQSTNGIRIDGVRCDSGWLRPKNVLWIAKLRYQIDYTPSGDGPPAEENPFAKSLLEKAGLTKQFDSGRDIQWGRQDQDPPRKRWTLDDH
jgi:pSer/pThr/pTyr-binding forkhead associated (FHA) protein